MKTSTYSFRQWRTLAIAGFFFTNLFLFTTGCEYLPDYLEQVEDNKNAPPLTLQEYFAKVNQVINGGDNGGDTTLATLATAKEYITAQAEDFAKQYVQLVGLNVPAQVKEQHTDLVKALAEQASSNQAAARNTPADLPNTIDNVNAYAHYWPEVGYARDDQSRIGCDLKSIADANNINFSVFGVCSAAGTVIDGKSIGTKDNPVNDVYIIHEPIAIPNNPELFRPNVDGFGYSSITAKAGVPITIRFDNRNSAPFVFNIALFKGNSKRVKASQMIASTLAYAGQKIHVLTVTLEPGTYTYVDNVHPVTMRGTLTVVR